MKTSLTVRIEADDAAKWQKAAEKAGVKISEWVRRGLNEYANGDDKAVRGVGDVVLDRGGAGTAQRRARVRPESVFRKIEDGAHQTFRDSGIAADEADESVPVSSAPPRHTAESKWPTCLCPSCTAKRKTLGLALGEIPVKKARR